MQSLVFVWDSAMMSPDIFFSNCDTIIFESIVFCLKVTSSSGPLGLDPMPA